MNKRKQTKNGYDSKRQSPIVIKISKNILYMILAISIISLIVSATTLITTMYNPIKTNKKLDGISENLTEIIRIWQAGGIDSSNNGDNNSGNKNEENEIAPDINDSFIQEQLSLIGAEMLNLAKNEDLIKAMTELDTSSLSVKGVVSNIQIPSVAKSYTELSKFKETNRYIGKAFYGTKGENFVSTPELEVSKNYKPSSEQWYQLAKTSGSIQSTQVYQDEFTKEYMVTVSFMVKDKDREIGVIGAQVNLSKMK